jgi:transposase
MNCDLPLPMVDEILNSDADPSIKELLKHLTKTIENLRSTIEKQTAQIEKLNSKIEQKDAELSELRRALFGRKSEKMPPMNRDVKTARKTKERTDTDKEKTQRRRKQNSEVKKTLPAEEVNHEVPSSE